MNYEAITEGIAIIGLVVIAVFGIICLGVEGKEIPLSIGSGVCGYLAKSAVEAVKKP